jgi:hypothetical protein
LRIDIPDLQFFLGTYISTVEFATSPTFFFVVDDFGKIPLGLIFRHIVTLVFRVDRGHMKINTYFDYVGLVAAQ